MTMIFPFSFFLFLSATATTVANDQFQRIFEGILIADQRSGLILLTRDNDGDGTANSEGETITFFQDDNITNIFTLHATRDNYVFAGDGDTDTVYRMKDMDDDGVADDVSVWFSEADNYNNFTLPTPNGLYYKYNDYNEDGALYILNAGTGSRPDDCIYRTVDLNGDGDANDEGEATKWMDIQAILEDLIPESARSSAFELVFLGDTAFISDSNAGKPLILAARDINRNGVIESDEAYILITEDNPFGVQLFFALTENEKNNDLYVAGGFNNFTITRLLLNRIEEEEQKMSSDEMNIDSMEQVQGVWESSLAPVGTFSNNFAIAATPEDGELFVTSNGREGENNIFRMIDLDGDGKFYSPGETIIWKSGAPMRRPRNVEPYYKYILVEPTSSPVEPTAPPAGPLPGLCFSGNNMVEVQGKGLVSMESLSIGDAVRVEGGEFSTVYSFGHYDKNAYADYLQIKTKGLKKPLELSKDHMLYVQSPNSVEAVAAGLVNVGDMVVSADGMGMMVEAINEVKRRGAFAPFTKTGNIIVSGVVASNYVSLMETGLPVSMQWIAHTFNAPHRMICSLSFEICEKESYTNGISNWVYGGLRAGQWLAKQSSFVQMTGSAFLFVTLLGVAAIEFATPALVFMLGALVYLRKKKKIASTST